jgi:hypothetical protein
VHLLICPLVFYLNLFLFYFTSIPLPGYDYILVLTQRSRHVTMLLAGRSGVQNSARSRNFPFSKNVQTGPGTQPTPSSMGTGIISRRVKRPWHEVDLAEVKNEWKYTSPPFIRLYDIYKDKLPLGVHIILRWENWWTRKGFRRNRPWLNERNIPIFSCRNYRNLRRTFSRGADLPNKQINRKNPEQKSEILPLCEVITPTSCEIYLRSN